MATDGLWCHYSGMLGYTFLTVGIFSSTVLFGPEEFLYTLGILQLYTQSIWKFAALLPGLYGHNCLKN